VAAAVSGSSDGFVFNGSPIEVAQRIAMGVVVLTLRRREEPSMA